MRETLPLWLVTVVVLAACSAAGPTDAGPTEAGPRDAGPDADPNRCCRRGSLPCSPGQSLGGVAGPDGCADNVSNGADGTWRRTVDEAGCPVWEDYGCCSPTDVERDIYCCGCPPPERFDGGPDAGPRDGSP